MVKCALGGSYSLFSPIPELLEDREGRSGPPSTPRPPRPVSLDQESLDVWSKPRRDVPGGSKGTKRRAGVQGLSQQVIEDVDLGVKTSGLGEPQPLSERSLMNLSPSKFLKSRTLTLLTVSRATLMLYSA